MRARHGHVEDGQAIDVDADREKIMRDEARAEAGQLPPDERIVGVEPPIGAPGGIFWPVRRAHPLHAPALLVDQDGRLIAADRVAQSFAERLHLAGIVDVALEEDEPPGLRIAEERDLIRGESVTRTADDKSA